MNFLNKFPWYTFFIAMYFPLVLLVGNVGEVGLFAANRTIVFILLVELLLLMLLKMMYKDWQKAGFAAAMLTAIMLLYGHVYSLLEKVEIVGLPLGRHRYLLFLSIIFAGLVFYLAGRFKHISTFEVVAKPISILLVMFVMFNLSSSYYTEWQALQRFATGEELAHQGLQADTGNVSPDVYYIILDAYGSSDVLSQYFQTDNTEFLNALRTKGFFIVDCGQSNYAHTHLSLASSLNYNYLEGLGDNFVPGNKSRAGLTDLIRNSAVRHFFEDENYQIVAFETDYAWTEWRDADLFIESKERFLSRNMTAFESLFFHTTIGTLLVEFGLIPEPQQTIQHYETIQSSLNALEELPDEEGPKFVFAHLVIPHHPFVFYSDGTYRPDPSLSPAFENYTDEEYYNGYSQQVMYINDRILKIVERIMWNSKQPSIIIIQGDHGPSHAGKEARMSILNAIYLPDQTVNHFDADLTPVNTFRVILNTYFGQNLPILPNVSYFSKTTDPYAYTVIPNECKP